MMLTKCSSNTSAIQAHNRLCRSWITEECAKAARAKGRIGGRSRRRPMTWLRLHVAFCQTGYQSRMRQMRFGSPLKHSIDGYPEHPADVGAL
jgi:hypothetical protein